MPETINPWRRAKARTALPDVLALFGDMARYPLFREMAVVCEDGVRAHALRWPLRFGLCDVPPDPPDFAGLTSLYCNHLAVALAPEWPGVTNGEGDVAMAAGELAFLTLAARSYARRLPPPVSQAVYLDNVAALLLEGMRLSYGEDRAWCELVARAAGLALDGQPGESSLIGAITDYFMQLPFAQRRSRRLSPARATYADGQGLRAAFCRQVALMF